MSWVECFRACGTNRRWTNKRGWRLAPRTNGFYQVGYIVEFGFYDDIEARVFGDLGGDGADGGDFRPAV